MHTIYNLHVCNNWPVFLWSQKSYCMHFYTAVFLFSINKDVVHLHFPSEVLCLRSRHRVNLFDFFVCIYLQLWAWFAIITLLTHFFLCIIIHAVRVYNILIRLCNTKSLWSRGELEICDSVQLFAVHTDRETSNLGHMKKKIKHQNWDTFRRALSAA